MKNENAFNAFLSKELRKLQPKGYHYVKASDKFTVGISDFIIWGRGRSVALESKFISKIPSEGSKLLQHTFSGAQVTFLESIGLSGNRAFGLVATDLLIYLVPWDKMPSGGNWEVTEFFGERYRSFDYKEIRQMVDYLLGWEKI